jgi:hypothetical protein
MAVEGVPPARDRPSSLRLDHAAFQMAVEGVRTGLDRPSSLHLGRVVLHLAVEGLLMGGPTVIWNDVRPTHRCDAAAR